METQLNEYEIIRCDSFLTKTFEITNVVYIGGVYFKGRFNNTTEDVFFEYTVYYNGQFYTIFYSI